MNIFKFWKYSKCIRSPNISL